MPKSSRTRRSPRRKSTPNGELVSEILNLDPLKKLFRYTSITDTPCGDDKAERTAALNYLRFKVIDTIGVPLVILCDELPPAPDLDIKLAILRQYVRQHNLHQKDGRGDRGFWKKVDEFYDDKIEKWGGSFASPGWKRYLSATMEEDEELVPPPPPIDEIPLFTYTPLVMKLFSILN
ncbi:hypothetical protein B0H19DRAFT_1247090 [Mycena capillaripes]|nr:hypothetical protein B0H19DRAFT_1247090 [Mycena capillaripes]